MPLIGVRELREQTSKVIKQVRECRAEYVVTYQGQPVALILPLDTEWAKMKMARASKSTVIRNWERYERLAKEIRCAWPLGLSTQDLIDTIRR